MWKISQSDAAKDVLPTAAEMKQAFRLPEQKQTDPAGPNYIVWMQGLICLLMLGAVLFTRQFQPDLYQSFRAGYQQALSQGVQLSGTEELVKFANGAMEDVRVKTKQAMASLETQLAESSPTASVGLGAGGTVSGKKPKTPPAGCSLESYLPKQTLGQPLAEYWLSSGYGWRKDPFTGNWDFHRGSDLAAAEGTPIHPALPGVIQKSSYNSSYGNYVLVLHDNGVATRYCHMQYVFVRQGERVTAEDILGTVGQTGAATGPHLHFELMHDDVRYDPAGALEL